MDLEQIKKRYFEVLKSARDITISKTEEQVKSFSKESEIKKLVFNSINSFETGDTDITAYCDILEDVKSLSDMIQDELCEKFEYAGILAKIGSSEDGLKINELDEFDNLYLCNLPKTHEFVEQDKEHYSVFDKDSKKELKPKEVIEKFADCLETVVPEFIDNLKNLTNGGYASPAFSGVRLNGPAVTILLKDEHSAGQIISIDYTIAFRLRSQDDKSLSAPVESKITQIQTEIKNKPITRNRFCIVPDVINDEWVVSSAHVEAGIFHDLSQASPVKKAIQLTKVICKDVSAHNQQVEQECGILFQNPKFTDEIVRMLDSYQDEPDYERRIEFNRWMRYGHIFLPKETEKKYNEIIKSGVSFNSAAVKHAILNECLNMEGCFQDKSDKNMELKLASELFKIFERVPRDVKQVFLDLPLNSFGVSGVASEKWNRQIWCQIIQEQCSIISKVLDSPIPNRRTSKRESVEGQHPPKRIKSSHQSMESGSGAGGTASCNGESTKPISSAMEKSIGEICHIMARVIDKRGLIDLKNRGCALVYIADHESTAIIKFTKQSKSATAMYLVIEIDKSYIFKNLKRVKNTNEGDPHFEVIDMSAKGQTRQIFIPDGVEIIKPREERYRNQERSLDNAVDSETFSSVTGKVVKVGRKKYIWMGNSYTRCYYLIDTEDSKPTKVVVFTSAEKDQVPCTEGDVINVMHVLAWQNAKKETERCLIAYKYPAIKVIKDNCKLAGLTTDWVADPDDSDANKGDQVKVDFELIGIEKTGVYQGCQDCRKEMKEESCTKCGGYESQLFFYTHMVVTMEPEVEQNHCCVFQSDWESIMPEIPDLEQSVECETQLQDGIAELLPLTGKGVIDKNVLNIYEITD